MNDVAEQRHERHIKRLYGISGDQYRELLDRQGNACAICLKDAGEFKTRLAVDHNHLTGEVRGLACAYCNHRILGRHRDSALLRRMADYLDRGTGWYIPEKIKTRKRKGRNVRSKQT